MTTRGLCGNGRDGNVLIIMAASLAALLAFGIVAIDGVILMTSKTQLQNAADAAALAGASGLVSSQAEAVQRAIDFAGFNRAVQDTMAPVGITAADVSFPTPNQCRVVTHRTAATGDPLRTYFLRVVDLARPNTADMTAVATAELIPICGTDCLKPWAVPDRWDDLNANEEWDEGEPYDPEGTGYMPPEDVGVQITLKWGTPSQSLEPGHFLPIDFPPLPAHPLTGGDNYRTWISECEPFPVQVGDSLSVEPGNMVGPTSQGMDAMLARDPDAEWDEDTNTVINSAFPVSPRVIKVPFYDPSRPPRTGRNYVFVVKIGAFFLEEAHGHEVTARFMQLATPGTPCDPNAPTGFMIGFALVE